MRFSLIRPLRLPPTKNTISLVLIRFFFTFRWQVGSLQFRTTPFLHTVSHIPEVSRWCFPVSSHLPWSSPNRTGLDFLISFLFRKVYLTIRQNSLYVTVCMIARTSFQSYFTHPLSSLHYCNAPDLATRLTGDYRDRTYIGWCGPASLDILL